MKVIIAGSREWMNESIINSTMYKFPHPIEEIVSGMAVGADFRGRIWADNAGYSVKPFPVTEEEWNKHGKAAGPMRNTKMAEYADALVAFWDGKSPGTRDMIKQARARKLLVWVVNPFGEIKVYAPQKELGL